MTDTQRRQYLDDVPKDIQDLIFENRCPEATQLLMDQKGLGKMQAAMEAARTATRMSEKFPEAVPGPSQGSRPILTAKQQSIAAWALVSLFVLVGAVFAGIGIHGLALGLASRNWPSTEGRIIQSKVERRTSGSGTDRRSAYYALVTYEFTIGGATYKGDRVASADIGRGKSAYAGCMVKRYPKGSSVTVYYMPEKPSRCLLEPGLQGQSFILPSVGLLVLLLGGVFLCAQLSVMRDERKAAEQSPGGDSLKTAPQE